MPPIHSLTWSCSDWFGSNETPPPMTPCPPCCSECLPAVNDWFSFWGWNTAPVSTRPTVDRIVMYKQKPRAKHIWIHHSSNVNNRVWRGMWGFILRYSYKLPASLLDILWMSPKKSEKSTGCQAAVIHCSSVLLKLHELFLPPNGRWFTNVFRVFSVLSGALTHWTDERDSGCL